MTQSLATPNPALCAGSWAGSALLAHAAYRGSCKPSHRGGSVGFRLSRKLL